MLRRFVEQLVELSKLAQVAVNAWRSADSEDSIVRRAEYLAVESRLDDVFSDVHIMVKQLKKDGLLALELRLLGRVLVDELEREFARRELRSTLVDSQESLEQLIAAMIDADRVLVAARQLNESLIVTGFDDATAALEPSRSVDLLVRTCHTFRLLLSEQDSSPQDSLVAWQSLDHWQTRYDELAERLQNQLEDLGSTGGLSYELEILEPSARRFLVEFADTHLTLSTRFSAKIVHN